MMTGIKKSPKVDFFWIQRRSIMIFNLKKSKVKLALNLLLALTKYEQIELGQNHLLWFYKFVLRRATSVL